MRLKMATRWHGIYLIKIFHISTAHFILQCRRIIHFALPHSATADASTGVAILLITDRDDDEMRVCMQLARQSTKGLHFGHIVTLKLADRFEICVITTSHGLLRAGFPARHESIFMRLRRSRCACFQECSRRHVPLAYGQIDYSYK